MLFILSNRAITRPQLSGPQLSKLAKMFGGFGGGGFGGFGGGGGMPGGPGAFDKTYKVFPSSFYAATKNISDPEAYESSDKSKHTPILS